MIKNKAYQFSLLICLIIIFSLFFGQKYSKASYSLTIFR